MTTELWIADTELLALDTQLERMLGLLPEPDQAKAMRFRKREDRLRCVTGRLMIRALAAVRLGQADIPLLISAYGKPFFAEENAVQFSLSHAGKLVVLAFGDYPLGVDVEENRPLAWRELASVFGNEEQRLLEADEDPAGLFYRFWTVREAFSKEEGRGLPIFESRDIVIDYDRETIRYEGRTLRVRTWEFQGYTLSVCASRLGEVRLRCLSSEDWNRVLSCNEGSRSPKSEEELEKRFNGTMEYSEEMMTADRALTLPVALDSFDEIRLTVLKIAGDTPETRQALLACDEMLANIVNYSKAENLSFACKRLEGQLCIQFSDDGIAFDPTAYYAEEKAFESLDSGGMGLGMIAQIASAIHYERKNGRNVNTLFFSLQNDTTHLTS
ncbi:MAG: ATP-binding protein [Oscillospiraceae bacterium]|nr:ATP-binding protein [Oscillospiraceae bacterium]